MSRLPTRIHDAEGVRALDRCAIEREGIPGYTLMCRAGTALLDAVESDFPACGRLLVVCGAGNNAGDGYVLARLAREEGYRVMVTALIAPDSLTGDAARAWQDYAAGGGEVIDWDPRLLTEADLVVDAILGTGLTRDVGGAFGAAVDAINDAGLPVLAVDIPSGLDADDGRIRGTAIRADTTVTFVGLKAGLVTGVGPDLRGRLRFSDLAVPPACADAAEPVLRRLDEACLPDRFPPRSRSAHKGAFGHLLIVGGAPGMPGAVRLAGEAALRAGAGLVTVATHPEHAAIITAARPELMCRGVTRSADLEQPMARATHLALGPGLGTGEWGREMLDAALASGLPAVVDADALNLLAESPRRYERWILTPHPGEAARLLGTDTADVQSDRVRAAAGIVERYGGVVILKGAGTVVCDAGDELAAICSDGNPGMASPGMGDVLTGIVGAMLAQGLAARQAAETGVLV
ncbi:MAG: NAD(P)H-hydrate dehydratase, partial [Gammaproteobacteria bacterium]